MKELRAQAPANRPAPAHRGVAKRSFRPVSGLARVMKAFTFPCRGTVVFRRLRSLTVAGAAPD